MQVDNAGELRWDGATELIRVEVPERGTMRAKEITRNLAPASNPEIIMEC